jgi:hypothetical protein
MIRVCAALFHSNPHRIFWELFNRAVLRLNNDVAFCDAMGSVDARRVWAGWWPPSWVTDPNPRPTEVDQPEHNIAIGDRITPDTATLAILSGFRNVTPSNIILAGTPSALPPGDLHAIAGLDRVLVFRSDPPPPCLPRQRPAEQILVASLAAAEDAELSEPVDEPPLNDLFRMIRELL